MSPLGDPSSYVAGCKNTNLEGARRLARYAIAVAESLGIEAASLLNSCIETGRTKGRDYTKGARDPLANFYAVSERLGAPVLLVWGIYVLKHVDAVGSYLAGLGESEPIFDRLKDIIVYAGLGNYIASRELDS